MRPAAVMAANSDDGPKMCVVASLRTSVGDAAIELAGALDHLAHLARIGAECRRPASSSWRFGDAAHGARQDEAALPVGLAGPAALDLVGDAIHAVGDALGDLGGLRRIGHGIGIERADDGGLLEDGARVAGVEGRRSGARCRAPAARYRADRRRCATCHPASLKRRIVDAAFDEVVLERALVLEVLLGRTALDLIERRLGDVDVAAIDQLAHLAVEERQQQRSDVGAVDVGVGHDDDLVVAQLVGVEFFAADRGAERHHQIADLLGAQHAIEAGALDIEDLAAQRQHGLGEAVAALRGGAAGAVALDEEDLGLGRVLLGAILELAGEEVDVERRFAARQFARLARGFAGGGGFGDLADDDAGFLRMLLEPLLRACR